MFKSFNRSLCSLRSIASLRGNDPKHVLNGLNDLNDLNGSIISKGMVDE